jgi:hypothetical protein
LICTEPCTKERKPAPLKVALRPLDDLLLECPSVVVAYGGGTDSTAMIIELVRRRVPIEAILFADTGGEMEHTYAFIELFSFWLKRQGYPGVTTVYNIPTRGPNRGVWQRLYESLWKNSALPPVAFNMHTCSERFKIRPQDRWTDSQEWARTAWGRGEKVLKLIGFEAGENRRINRTHPLIVKSGKFEAAYPLVEWGWDRAKCIEVIESMKLPQPGKSACFFCPMRKPKEIRELARFEPAKLAKALELERRALESGKIKNPDIKGLGGRKFAWSDLVASWGDSA